MSRGGAKRLPNDGTIERAIGQVLDRLEQREVRCIQWHEFGMMVTEHIIQTNPSIGWGRNYGRLTDQYKRLAKHISSFVRGSIRWRKGDMTIQVPVIWDEGALGDVGDDGREPEFISKQVPALRRIVDGKKE